MTKYRNAFIDDDIEDENEELEQIVVPDDATVEEKTFAKRYGDLRRHTQKEKNELTQRIADLENRLTNSTANSMDLPTSEEDIEDWVKKYPDVAKIVIGIARQQATSATVDLDKRVRTLDEREAKLRKEEALKQILLKHSDFYEISADPKFHEWMEEQDQATQDAIYVNEEDYRAANRVLSDYKYENNIGPAATPKPKSDRRSAAEDVPTRGGSAPTGTKNAAFTESQIARMTDQEYERNSDAIDKASREGRITYDITGGAR